MKELIYTSGATRNPSLTAPIIPLTQSICSSVEILNLKSTRLKTPSSEWLTSVLLGIICQYKVKTQKKVF